MKHTMDSKAVIRSLRAAFDCPIDYTKATRRVHGMLSHYPDGSLHVIQNGDSVSFYEYVDNKRMYLSKKSDKLYALARKRYLDMLLQTIELLHETGRESGAWEKQFEKLAKLIHQYAKGNLDLARIVLTNKQYSWLTKQYRKKKIMVKDNETPLTLRNGVTIRSKSEQNIGNALLDLAIPNHYEELLQINVMSLVKELETALSKSGWKNGPLYHYSKGVCYWNVPDNLQHMNASGSIWHTFDYRTGCISIYPDFTVMLIDNSLLYWEHEGLLLNFVYRANASERVATMRICGDVNQSHLIQTTENESNDRDIIDEIIEQQIVSRIWF